MWALLQAIKLVRVEPYDLMIMHAINVNTVM